MYDPTQPLTGAQVVQLLADLNPNRIANRKQGGSTLSYLEGWDIRASLIKVFGFGGWDADLQKAEILKVEEFPREKPLPSGQKHDYRVTAMCTFRLRIHQLGASYTEAAVSSQKGPDFGEVTDFAVKTAETDAFKRCAVNLGTTFGLSLYNSGGTADVVKATRDPHQSEILKAWQKELEKRAEEGKRAVAETGANPATGEVPADDPVLASPEAIDDATAKARAAFQRA